MAITPEDTSLDLSKLTVAQLKALCKDRRITGYSKLSKPALLERLAASPSGKVAPTGPRSDPSTRPDPAALKVLHRVSSSEPLAPTPGLSTAHEDIRDDSRVAAITMNDPPRGADVLPNTTSAQSCLLGTLPLHAETTVSVRSGLRILSPSTPNVHAKRLHLPDVSQATPIAKRLKTSFKHSFQPASETNASSTTVAYDTASPSIGLDFSTAALQPAHKRSRLSSAQCLPATAHSKHEQPVHTVSKPHKPISTAQLPRRFKALVPKGPLPMADPLTVAKRSGNTSARPPVSLYYLEPTALEPQPTLSVISWPPKVAQRKHVQRWALLLSGISDSDRRHCVQVSRMFRYAVYLSATIRLDRDFSGKRLASQKQMHSQAMTNMWPYLRYRENELAETRRIYGASFLHLYFRDRNPISPHLWSNPDHEKQATVTLRFVLTCLWFSLSVGGSGCDGLDWTRSTVEDVREVVAGEIWMVATIDTLPQRATPGGSRRSFYILESTCEVLGHVPSSDLSLQESSLRPDWAAYIAHRVLPPSARDSPPTSLFEHLTWTNHEEYTKGISLLWLKRIEGEGCMGLAKRSVAERYVLACTFSNSVSGRWMSSTQMEQEFAGLPSSTTPVRTRIPSAVHLFLPEHHLVESVHFTTSRGEVLHPAVAVIQTPAREYFVLKDNGMQIGVEEEGIAAIWRKVIGCSVAGVAVSA